VISEHFSNQCLLESNAVLILFGYAWKWHLGCAFIVWNFPEGYHVLGKSSKFAVSKR
jgi:hypothetical protein